MSFGKFLQHNLEDLLKAGASLELNAAAILQHNLENLAKCAKRGGATLTLTNASGLLQHNLISIARAGEGSVTFKD
ncbi:hypothetical protein ACVWZ9_003986 [Pseudomonas chlororaphis]